MKYFKSLLTTTLCFTLFVASVHAQKNKDNTDRIYDNMGYKAAIPLYESKASINMEEMSKLANAYRLISDTENAEYWYAQFVDESTIPKQTLYYAQTLQRNGRFELAKQYYMKYDKMVGSEEGSGKRRTLLAAAIDRMNQLEYSEKATIKNESLINTKKIDFSPTFYKDGIIFVSTRGVQSVKHENIKGSWVNDNLMTLFYADKNLDGALTSVKEFSIEQTTKSHEGPVCFTKNGSKIFFTRNDHLNKNRRNSSEGTTKLQIYTSVKVDDSWSEPRGLPFNTREYDEAHPAISPDGTKLYFASDRPGGFGKIDIYVSEFINGRWGTGKNLGPKINTAGNEAFPFIHDDGTIYFASDGLGGLGGFDIFSSIQDDEGNWTKSKNIGTPFNSNKDDFGFILNVLKTEGYFTSSRGEGAGRDDIYSFVIPQDAPIEVRFCAYEEGSGNRISDVQFKIVEQFKDNITASANEDAMILEEASVTNGFALNYKGKEVDLSNKNSVKLFNTDEIGEFKTHFKNNRKYQVIATKDGYKVAEETIDGEMLQGKRSKQFCIPLKKMRCVNLDGVVERKKYKKAIPNAVITLTNLCTGEEHSVTSNEEGYFYFPCVECGCDFILKSQKHNFSDGTAKQSTNRGICILGATLSTVIKMNDSEEDH